MAQITGPGGAPTPDNGTATYYESLFTTKYGASAGSAYLAYNTAHPGSTAYANANAFLELILVQGLDKAIQTAVTGTAQTEAGVPAAAAQGASNAYKTLTAPISTVAGLISAITSANTWIRVAKVIIGGVLLIVGLVHMTGADNAVATVARKVPLPI